MRKGLSGSPGHGECHEPDRYLFEDVLVKFSPILVGLKMMWSIGIQIKLIIVSVQPSQVSSPEITAVIP